MADSEISKMHISTSVTALDTGGALSIRGRPPSHQAMIFQLDLEGTV